MKRQPEADYELCTVLLMMLLREDHFFNGSFERRCRVEQVQPIIDRMVQLLNIFSNTRYDMAEDCICEASMMARSIDIEPDDIDVSDTATFVWEIE